MRRPVQLLSLLGLVRLMVVALALQLSGATPAFAFVAEVVREQVAPPHACPCCLAAAARERAELGAERDRDSVRDPEHGCCGSSAAGTGCADRCAGCGSARDSKSFTNEESLSIALPEAVARVAAAALAEAGPPFVQITSIYRPPCA